MDNCGAGGDRYHGELLHCQDSRLKSKYLQTLALLKDNARENEHLQGRIKELELELEEKCTEIHGPAEEHQSCTEDVQRKKLQYADEIEKSLTDQHRSEMMQVLDDKLEMEKRLKEDMLKLQHELESLHRTNVTIKEETSQDEEKKYRSQLRDMELQLGDLQIEVEDVTSERDKLQMTLNESQAKNADLRHHQMQDLLNTNQSLTQELTEVQLKNSDLESKIETLERRLRDRSAYEEHSKLVEALRHKTWKLFNDNRLAEEREVGMKARCEEMHMTNSSLQTTMKALEQDKSHLVQQTKDLSSEVAKLKKRLHREEKKSAFRDFVAMKREVNTMRDENESLRQKIRDSSCSLPFLREELFMSTAKTGKGKKVLGTKPCFG